MPEDFEFGAARLFQQGVGEDFVGFEIEEAQPHGPMPHDAFKMAAAAAAAIGLFGI